jgi:tRNA threonylcarbamoyladenosine biosynthesis protein TsaB
MKILAFDTSTAACSVAILNNDQLVSEHIVQPRGHANLILDMVEALLSNAKIGLSDLDVISFGQGPGSFTGLRIAAGVCQGIAYSQNIPVIALSSLRILAQGVFRETSNANIAVLQDARMSEVYWGCYIERNGIMELNGIENVSKPELIQLDSSKSWYSVGEALIAYKDNLKLPEQAERSNRESVNNEFIYPNAIDMIALTQYEFEQNNSIKAEDVNPIYIRNKVASKKQ